MNLAESTDHATDVSEPFSLPQRPAIEGALHLPLALLKPSPTNPRKHFDDGDLKELAASITTHGLLQPILARPAPNARPGQPLYEIVAGERRWRASQMAQQPSIMALVRDMTDFDVLEVQLIENLKRSDLTELEEAEGYSALLRKPNGLQGYASADELAARIGKSRSYVAQRLKLLDLKDAGRQALASGKISFSVALLIARLPNQQQQDEATASICRGWGGEPLTYKAATDYIHRTFHLELDRAPFTITDATLLPSAGSCRDCGKRTGANPDLFADVRKADTCTDGACYQAKEEAHRARVKAEAEASGATLITGKDAKKAKPQAFGSLKGYLELDKVHLQLGDKPLRKLLGKKLPEVLKLEDPHTRDLVDVVREPEALALLREAGVLSATRMPGTSQAERDAERVARQEVAYRLALAQRITEAAAGNAGADSAFRAQLMADVGVRLWHLLSSDNEKRAERLLAWEHIGSEYAGKGNTQRKEDRIRGLDDGQFTQYLVAVLCSFDMHVNASTVKGSKPSVLLQLAARLGVDAKALREELRSLQRVKGTSSEPKAERPRRHPVPAGAALTPETALSAAIKKAKTKTKGQPPVAYRCPDTGSTWSGRGLQPRWLKVALADGKTLADFATGAPATPASSRISDAAADPFRQS